MLIYFVEIAYLLISLFFISQSKSMLCLDTSKENADFTSKLVNGMLAMVIVTFLVLNPTLIIYVIIIVLLGFIFQRSSVLKKINYRKFDQIVIGAQQYLMIRSILIAFISLFFTISLVFNETNSSGTKMLVLISLILSLFILILSTTISSLLNRYLQPEQQEKLLTHFKRNISNYSLTLGLIFTLAVVMANSKSPYIIGMLFFLGLCTALSLFITLFLVEKTKKDKLVLVINLLSGLCIVLHGLILKSNFLIILGFFLLYIETLFNQNRKSLNH